MDGPGQRKIILPLVVEECGIVPGEDEFLRRLVQARFECPYCDYRCFRKYDLDRHVRKHTGEKPYGCNQCEMKYSRLEHLKTLAEISRLLESNPFGLTLLPVQPKKTTANASGPTSNGSSGNNNIITTNSSSSERTSSTPARRGPLAGQGPDAPEKPYGCTHCAKTFSNRNNLKYHMSTHIGGKPYKCKGCDYRTAYPSGIYQHNKVCPGKRQDTQSTGLQQPTQQPQQQQSQQAQQQPQQAQQQQQALLQQQQHLHHHAAAAVAQQQHLQHQLQIPLHTPPPHLAHYYQQPHH
ncbi:zinc finger protein squeeze-like [Varroa destructor]|uniref:C2H2-type domain-containing protein n=1 Tax=Varroa destructor TaxID=109461 RepID=A0A7M7KBP9_VARDE|nr:zinc finger protein squeeze-like [Varroa destructor]